MRGVNCHASRTFDSLAESNMFGQLWSIDPRNKQAGNFFARFVWTSTVIVMAHDSTPLPAAGTGSGLPLPGRGVPPLHERIADALRVAIARGVYPPGSKLPTEAELSSLHGAGRGTIRA